MHSFEILGFQKEGSISVNHTTLHTGCPQVRTVQSSWQKAAERRSYRGCRITESKRASRLIGSPDSSVWPCLLRLLSFEDQGFKYFADQSASCVIGHENKNEKMHGTGWQASQPKRQGSCVQARMWFGPEKEPAYAAWDDEAVQWPRLYKVSNKTHFGTNDFRQTRYLFSVYLKCDRYFTSQISSITTLKFSAAATQSFRYIPSMSCNILCICLQGAAVLWSASIKALEYSD